MTAATVPPTGGSNSDTSVDGSIEKMTEAFNRAIATSAEITAVTTEKKAALDASKQRPQ